MHELGDEAIHRVLEAQADKLPLDGVYLKVNEKMETNVPGIFAAGDATGGLLQVAKAVHEGAVAGLSALKFLRGKKA